MQNNEYYNEYYNVHKYNGEVYNLTLQEIFKHFTAYQFKQWFGYGTDFGKFISTFRFNHGCWCFNKHDDELKVYYKYLFFITNSTGKLMQPEQIFAEYCIKYNPTHYLYVGGRKYISTGWKRKNRRHYRCMKTTAERRAVKAVLKEEGEPEFRGRRKSLPNKWDDYWIFYDRSWKSQSKRKRQYKGS